MILNPSVVLAAHPKLSYHSGLGEMSSKVTHLRFQWLLVTRSNRPVKRLLMRTYSHIMHQRGSVQLNLKVWKFVPCKRNFILIAVVINPVPGANKG